MNQGIKHAVICCSDPRQWKQVLDHFQQLYRNFDPIVFPGGCLPFINLKSRKFFLKNLRLLRRLHGFTNIDFVNHTGLCGAYADYYGKKLVPQKVHNDEMATAVDHIGRRELKYHTRDLARVQTLLAEDKELHSLTVEGWVYHLPAHRLEKVVLAQQAFNYVT